MKNINSLYKKSKTRREFLKDITLGFGTIAVGTYSLSYLTACEAEDDGPVAPGKGDTTAKITVDITKPENKNLATIGGTIAITGDKLDPSGILIIRTGEKTVTALSRKCTHKGCTVPNFSNGVSTCPCHGAKFDKSGNVLGGPAPSPLKKYNATISGNIITITA